MARRYEAVFLIAGILIIAMPFPTAGYGIADAFYARAGDVVEGQVINTRNETRYNSAAKQTQRITIGEVSLAGSDKLIEMELDLYPGIVWPGETIKIEAADGPFGPAYRPSLEDDGQYGIWKMTGTIWLIAAAVAALVWKTKTSLQQQGLLKEAASQW